MLTQIFYFNIIDNTILEYRWYLHSFYLVDRL